LRAQAPLVPLIIPSEFLRGQGESVALASYDSRLIAAAQALGISIVQW
jgi:hypothetical protein